MDFVGRRARSVSGKSINGVKMLRRVNASGAWMTARVHRVGVESNYIRDRVTIVHMQLLKNRTRRGLLLRQLAQQRLSDLSVIESYRYHDRK